MSAISDYELILSAVFVFVLIGAFVALWFASGRYITRLQMAHTEEIHKNARLLGANHMLRVELAETRAALERATGGTEDLLAAVYDTDGDGRWSA